jgi:hypothetical protein
MKEHDAGGAFVPARPAGDFDDAAEHATLWITGSWIRHACLSEDQLALISSDRENASVRACSRGRPRGCGSAATLQAEECSPREAVIAVNGTLGTKVARTILARLHLLYVCVNRLAALCLVCMRGCSTQQQTKHSADRSGQSDRHSKHPHGLCVERPTRDCHECVAQG